MECLEISGRDLILILVVHSWSTRPSPRSTKNLKARGGGGNW
jgi:hypothetical protein